MAAGAVPLVAATPPECTEVKNDIEVKPASTQNYTNNYERSVTTWTNTHGATLEVSYDIAGGGGGVNWNDGSAVASQPAGSGHRLTGTLLVPPGTTLTLIAGNGGIGIQGPAGQTPSSTTIKGGAGYGNGGDITTGNHSYRYGAGTGGGGSAILVGTGSTAKPIIVAGGGGGAGGAVTTAGTFTVVLDASGGHGGNPAVAGGQFEGRIRSINYIARGGGGANGATGGQPYSNHTQGNPTSDIATGAGYAGANHVGDGVNGGGNGASATLPPYTANVGSTTTIGSYVPGAGGGGYAGGASANWTVARPNPSSLNGAAMGGGGGGGSSFIAPGAVDGVTVVNSTPSLAGNGTSAVMTRDPGWARIEFGSC